MENKNLNNIKKLETPKYMMATTAIHKTGNINRDNSDLCIIFKEDEENWIGNWVTGFGFVDVKYPKSSTRELTADEVQRYHGSQVILGGMIHVLNLTNENFYKRVVVTKVEYDLKTPIKILRGELTGPVAVGKGIFMWVDAEGQFRSTNVTKIDGQFHYTKNSIYHIEYEPTS